jgi:carbonic anhydrase
MGIVDEVTAANREHASRFEHGDLAAPPRRRFAVVTCMDARLDPAKFLGLSEGDAHVIRNAGGIVSDDALRSLAISHHLLGTGEALVIGHTECGMATVRNEDVRARIGPAAEAVDFLTFEDVVSSVRESVGAIESSPLLPDSFGATGFVYDVRTGKLDPVDRAARTSAV